MRLTFLTILAAALLGLAACGGGEEDEAGATGTQPETGEAPEVELSDFGC